jgi:LysR family transcriptional regulator for metE and metH
LWSELYAVAAKGFASRPYFGDFVSIVRDTCAAQLDGIELLTPEGAAG